jgi:nucleoside-diphosphate-sugar epimerase
VTTIAITGSTGYVGGAIALRALKDGHDVVALTRRPNDSLPWRHYDLAEMPAAGVLRDVDVVVHCAYDLTLTRPRDIARVNVDGTRCLVDAAVAAGARFVLVSSMSAYPGTKQLYGRSKLAAERIVLEAGGEAIRLGLVYGDDGRGMIGALQRLVALPITPVMGRNAHQFTVHVDDMVSGVLSISLEAGDAQGAVGLADPRPVRFEDILIGLAHRTGSRMRPFSVPWPVVYGAMRLAELFRVPLPLRADSILGLVHPASFVPRTEFWNQRGLNVRAFEEWAQPLRSRQPSDT